MITPSILLPPSCLLFLFSVNVPQIVQAQNIEVTLFSRNPNHQQILLSPSYFKICPCGRQPLRWPPMTTSSWCSHPCVIPSQVWARFTDSLLTNRIQQQRGMSLLRLSLKRLWLPSRVLSVIRSQIVTLGKPAVMS